MNCTEIDVTPIVSNEGFVPFDLSNNRATLGDNAGALTWQASKEAAEDFDPLPKPEHREAFWDFVRNSGGWTREEIEAWTDKELTALSLQWLAGDIREAFGDADPEDWDWQEYRKDAEAGRVSSNLFKGEDGRIYFSIGY